MFHKHVLLTANRYTCRCVVSRNQGANIVAVCHSGLYEGSEECEEWKDVQTGFAPPY